MATLGLQRWGCVPSCQIGKTPATNTGVHLVVTLQHEAVGKPLALNSPQKKITCDSTHPRTFPPRTCGHCLALPCVCHQAHTFQLLSSHTSRGNWELPEFSEHSVYVTCLKDGDSTYRDLTLPTQWLNPHPTHTVDNPHPHTAVKPER